MNSGGHKRKEVIFLFSSIDLKIIERFNLKAFARALTEEIQEHPAFGGKVDIPLSAWAAKIEPVSLNETEQVLFTPSFTYKGYEIVVVHPETVRNRDQRFMTPEKLIAWMREIGTLPLPQSHTRSGGVFVVRVWPEYSREEVNSLQYDSELSLFLEEKLGEFGPERVYMRLFCAFEKKEGSL